MSESNTATSALEEEQTPCRLKSSNQRRSIIFRRRSMVQTYDDKDGSDDACTKQKPDEKKVNENDSTNTDDCGNKIEDLQFDLKKYITDLREEKKIWKQTLFQRRRRRKSMLKQTSDMQRRAQDVDLNLLSESERNFILARPNYEHISEKLKKLSLMADETELSKEQVMHLHNQCMLKAQKKLYNLKKRIIEMVD